MQYLQDDLLDLGQLFGYINQNNDVMPVNELMPTLFTPGVVRAQSAPTRTEVSSGLFLPHASEAARLYRNLRQRMSPPVTAARLVERMRAEVRPRYRPERNVSSQSLQGAAAFLAEIGGRSAYSQFQIDGWTRILAVLDSAINGQSAAAVVTAPTSAGKTEVFQLPVIAKVIAQMKKLGDKRIKEHPRYLLIYPRIALAQDQIERVFRYVAQARRVLNLPANQRIIIGLQFSGVRSKLQETLQDSKLFENSGGVYRFKLLDGCPWCDQPNSTQLELRSQGQYYRLSCPECGEWVNVSLSKDDHRRLNPHLMLTTAESLDRMYLDWDFRDYLPLLHGVIVDEAHLFNQVYGTHAHHLFRRIRDVVRRTSQRDLAFIASSATIGDAGDFARRLFYGTTYPAQAVIVIDGTTYPSELTGLEAFYFLQARRGQFGHHQGPATMIQAAMATAHGVLKDGKRAILFVESLDLAGRFQMQIEDAESERRLWQMRVLVQTPNFQFRGQVCPQTSPLSCADLYIQGECWRGMIGGMGCYQYLPLLRQSPVSVQLITGNTSGTRGFQSPLVVGTSALEVGVDDPTVQATLHYRPPRTVFDFIQRRGRAGRGYGELAHTVVVLGQEAADYYYLTRRHRIIDGTYELPLNPDNPVVRQIHDWIEQARAAHFDLVERKQGELAGIWSWVLCQMENCPHIIGKYATNIAAIKAMPNIDSQKQMFFDWITNGLQDAKAQLGAEWEIPQRRSRVLTPGLVAILDDLIARFEEWLEGDIDDVMFKSELDRLRRNAAEFVMQADPSLSGTTASADLAIVFQSIVELLSMADRGRAQSRQSLQEGRSWYDFFSRILRLNEGVNLYIFADTMRIVYQAAYFLHMGLQPHSCVASIPVFIPDTYFSSMQPMRVTLPGNKVTSEPITSLESMFSPYKLIYRYEEGSLYTLDTRPIGRAMGNNVQIRPVAEGPSDRDPNGREVIRVRGIQLRAIRGDSRQAVGVCQACFDVYDLARTQQNTACRCGGVIAAGFLYRERAYFDTGYDSGSGTPVSSTMSLLPSVRAWTTLHGSFVRFRTLDNQQTRSFNAWLQPALHYDIDTKGIRWQVPGLSEDRRTEKLHAAAHVLLKAVASVVGVREDQLEYSFDDSNGTASVWEKFEGGAGLCETFVDSLQRDPSRVYSEMIAVVACPIFLSEQRNILWQDSGSAVDDVASFLSTEFGLPASASTLTQIASETVAELAYTDPEGAVCSRFDGCPACVHAMVCTDNQPSRSDAWEVVRSLVTTRSAGQGSTALGQVIWLDGNQGIEYVLVI